MLYTYLLHTVSAACDQFKFFHQQKDTDTFLPADTTDAPEVDASGKVVTPPSTFCIKELHYAS